MIPSVYKFEVTLDRDQIERYNRWRANLPHTPERSIVNWFLAHLMMMLR